MAKQRNPKGMGSYYKLKDGRIRWRQTVDGNTREVSAKNMKLLNEKVKKIADLPIIKGKYKVDEWFVKWLDVYVKPFNLYRNFTTIFFLILKHRHLEMKAV